MHTKISLNGNWELGFACDLHTTDSTYLGKDANGNDKFRNIYTKMGELVNRLKYQNDKSALSEIISLINSINGRRFDFIIPIPPTDKTRSFQPVTELAIALGKSIGVPVLTDVLIKTPGGKQLKTITDPEEREKALRDHLDIKPNPLVHGKSVLLIDDVYGSGSTLRVSTDLLMKVAKVGVVFVLTMTKKRSN